VVPASPIERVLVTIASPRQRSTARRLSAGKRPQLRWPLTRKLRSSLFQIERVSRHSGASPRVAAGRAWCSCPNLAHGLCSEASMVVWRYMMALCLGTQ
jgi:hypothetical protein